MARRLQLGWDHMPHNLLQQIASGLSSVDKQRCQQVNRHWHSALHNCLGWRTYITKVTLDRLRQLSGAGGLVVTAPLSGQDALQLAVLTQLQSLAIRASLSTASARQLLASLTNLVSLEVSALHVPAASCAAALASLSRLTQLSVTALDPALPAWQVDSDYLADLSDSQLCQLPLRTLRLASTATVVSKHKQPPEINMYDEELTPVLHTCAAAVSGRAGVAWQGKCPLWGFVRLAAAPHLRSLMVNFQGGVDNTVLAALAIKPGACWACIVHETGPGRGDTPCLPVTRLRIPYPRSRLAQPPSCLLVSFFTDLRTLDLSTSPNTALPHIATSGHVAPLLAADQLWRAQNPPSEENANTKSVVHVFNKGWCLRDLTQLESLSLANQELGYNFLYEDLPELTRLTHLQLHLALPAVESSISLQHHTFSLLTRLTHLRRLVADREPVPELCVLPLLTGLRSLDLSGHLVGERLAWGRCPLPVLEELDISQPAGLASIPWKDWQGYKQARGAHVKALAALCPTLRHLNLQGCNVSALSVLELLRQFPGIKLWRSDDEELYRFRGRAWR